ncbi:MAG: hypothetical protein NDI69_02395 [Bacteriovoracaceae bacterium]|nr:hypothetical protein [Bacteriovoracaceae bacterium]
METKNQITNEENEKKTSEQVVKEGTEKKDENKDQHEKGSCCGGCGG